MRFGEYLVSKNVVPEESLAEAIEIQRFKKTRLGRLMRDLGLLSQNDLNKHLSLFLKPAPIVSVTKISEEFKTKSFGQEVTEWANRHGVLPLEFSREQMAFVSPCFKDDAIESAELHFKRPANLILVDLEGFKFLKAIANGRTATDLPLVLSEVARTDDQKIAALDPYTSLFRDTILAAQSLSASDIHIQPTREGIDIRFRINGDLLTWKTLDTQHRQSFVNEVKRLTNLSIAVSGRAQDGRVSFKNWKLDVRTSLLPSQYGEKIVLRILDLKRKFDLPAMGFDEETLTDLTAALKAKNGVVIISGPTGSGKTTTLYTLLNSLDRSTKNILTLEDPIEYGIEGITQVQINSKLGFSDALRAVLRQDPDVILVGEVRDAETADLCAKAAMTGHLVLSTLHANGASEVVSRLLNLGVDNFVLKSCLRFSAAQRLVRKLCPSCSEPITSREKERLSSEVSNRGITVEGVLFRARNPEGCSQCRFGVIGRTPILEYMKHHEIQDYLSSPLENSRCMGKSLLTSAMKLAERGEVDVFEALEID